MVYLVTTLLHIFLQNMAVKIFENWLIFGEDMDKHLPLTFMAHPKRIPYNYQ